MMGHLSITRRFLTRASPGDERCFQRVTSRHIQERLQREVLSDVALFVEELTECVGYKVSGRGELHLSILIERMRREGYEFQVSRPQVIFKEENGVKLEPYEELTIDVEEAYMGPVMEKMGMRKGIILEMQQDSGLARLIFKIPTRGLLGYRSEFMTDTRGMGIMNYVFLQYGPYIGDIKTRQNGVMIAKETCPSVAFALFSLQDRGKLFIGPGVSIYRGQIVGEHSRANDLTVNPGREKKLSNMRSSGTDEAVILTPPHDMSLEDCIAYINEDELVEVTPKAIRLRKSDV
jgi:GTP-binding protein